MSARSSVRMVHLGSFRKDFREILYSSIYRKFVEKSLVSLKSDKNNGHVNKGVCTFKTIISLSSSQDEICLRQNCKEEHPFLSSITLPENLAVYDIMLKNYRLQYDTAHALCVLGDLRLQTHTQKMQYLFIKWNRLYTTYK